MSSSTSSSTWSSGFTPALLLPHPNPRQFSTNSLSRASSASNSTSSSMVSGVSLSSFSGRSFMSGIYSGGSVFRGKGKGKGKEREDGSVKSKKKKRKGKEEEEGPPVLAPLMFGEDSVRIGMDVDAFVYPSEYENGVTPCPRDDHGYHYHDHSDDDVSSSLLLRNAAEGLVGHAQGLAHHQRQGGHRYTDSASTITPATFTSTKRQRPPLPPPLLIQPKTKRPPRSAARHTQGGLVPSSLTPAYRIPTAKNANYHIPIQPPQHSPTTTTPYKIRTPTVSESHPSISLSSPLSPGTPSPLSGETFVIVTPVAPSFPPLRSGEMVPGVSEAPLQDPVKGREKEKEKKRSSLLRRFSFKQVAAASPASGAGAGAGANASPSANPSSSRRGSVNGGTKLTKGKWRDSVPPDVPSLPNHLPPTPTTVGSGTETPDSVTKPPIRSSSLPLSAVLPVPVPVVASAASNTSLPPSSFSRSSGSLSSSSPSPASAPLPSTSTSIPPTPVSTSTSAPYPRVRAPAQSQSQSQTRTRTEQRTDNPGSTTRSRSKSRSRSGSPARASWAGAAHQATSGPGERGVGGGGGADADVGVDVNGQMSGAGAGAGGVDLEARVDVLELRKEREEEEEGVEGVEEGRSGLVLSDIRISAPAPASVSISAPTPTKSPSKLTSPSPCEAMVPPSGPSASGSSSSTFFSASASASKSASASSSGSSSAAASAASSALTTPDPSSSSASGAGAGAGPSAASGSGSSSSASASPFVRWMKWGGATAAGAPAGGTGSVGATTDAAEKKERDTDTEKEKENEKEIVRSSRSVELERVDAMIVDINAPKPQSSTGTRTRTRSDEAATSTREDPHPHLHPHSHASSHRAHGLQRERIGDGLSLQQQEQAQREQQEQEQLLRKRKPSLLTKKHPPEHAHAHTRSMSDSTFRPTSSSAPHESGTAKPDEKAKGKGKAMFTLEGSAGAGESDVDLPLVVGNGVRHHGHAKLVKKKPSVHGVQLPTLGVSLDFDAGGGDSQDPKHPTTSNRPPLLRRHAVVSPGSDVDDSAGVGLRRWTLANAMTDEGITDEGLVKELERMREVGEWSWRRERERVRSGLSGLGEGGERGDGHENTAAEAEADEQEAVYGVLWDMGREIWDGPGGRTRGLTTSPFSGSSPSLSPTTSNSTWLSAQRALLTCRELILTERHFLAHLLSLVAQDTQTPPPPLMLRYAEELVGASRLVLGGMESEPSVGGVARAFVEREEEVCAAYVRWCGVVGGWFVDVQGQDGAGAGAGAGTAERRVKKKRSRGRMASPVSAAPAVAAFTPVYGGSEHGHGSTADVDTDDGHSSSAHGHGSSSAIGHGHGHGIPLPNYPPVTPIKRPVSTWRRSMPSIASLGLEGGVMSIYSRREREKERERDRDREEVVGGDGLAPSPLSSTAGGNGGDGAAEAGKKSRKPLAVRELAILPTQRVMRYVLLYRDLLTHTPHTSPSRVLVERAVEAACRIAEKCDRAQGNAAFILSSSSPSSLHVKAAPSGKDSTSSSRSSSRRKAKKDAAAAAVTAKAAPPSPSSPTIAFSRNSSSTNESATSGTGSISGAATSLTSLGSSEDHNAHTATALNSSMLSPFPTSIPASPSSAVFQQHTPPPKTAILGTKNTANKRRSTTDSPRKSSLLSVAGFGAIAGWGRLGQTNNQTAAQIQDSQVSEAAKVVVL